MRRLLCPLAPHLVDAFLALWREEETVTHVPVRPARLEVHSS